MKLCLDSSFVAATVLPEGDATMRARGLSRNWLAQGVQFVAPDLWGYEVVSIVYKAVKRGRLSIDRGPDTLAEILRFPILLLKPPAHERAYALAVQFSLPAPYDAHYLAVAEAEGAEFWTGDKRLYDRVHAGLPWVHWLLE